MTFLDNDASGHADPILKRKQLQNEYISVYDRIVIYA